MTRLKLVFGAALIAFAAGPAIAGGSAPQLPHWLQIATEFTGMISSIGGFFTAVATLVLVARFNTYLKAQAPEPHDVFVDELLDGVREANKLFETRFTDCLRIPPPGPITAEKYVGELLRLLPGPRAFIADMRKSQWPPSAKLRIAFRNWATVVESIEAKVMSMSAMVQSTVRRGDWEDLVGQFNRDEQHIRDDIKSLSGLVDPIKKAAKPFAKKPASGAASHQSAEGHG